MSDAKLSDRAVPRCEVHGTLTNGLLAHLDGALTQIPSDEHRAMVQELLDSLNERLTDGYFGPLPVCQGVQ